jgi:outer membrane protein TolC
MKKEICIFSVALGALVLMLAASGQALTLDEYLQMVAKKNRGVLALDASTEAAGTRYQQADLELSPILSAGGNYVDDKSLNGSLGAVTTHSEVRTYSLGLSKKFSSGTQAAVVGAVQALNLEGTAPPAGYFNAENHVSTLGVSLSQSLWKDFFGRSTHLRWEREASQKEFEKTGYNLQAKQVFIEAEAAFWDLLYLQNELAIRQASLDRARKIESWVRQRAGNGIGDRADVLTAQSLTASRELEVIVSQENLKTAEEKFGLQIEWSSDQPIPALQADIGGLRPLKNFVSGEGDKIVRLDTYLAILDAHVKSVNSKEAEESVKPDLVLSGGYRTNGYDITDSAALGKITDKDHPVANVGVTFNWALDWDSKGAIRSTARADALSAQLKKERGLIESEVVWKELNRRHGDASIRVAAADKLSQVQTAKARAERDKLSKGRAITSDVITAEQDAADAELNLSRLKAEQRKIEAQSRLFVRIQEVP